MTTTPTPLRRFTGVLRIAAGLLVLAAVMTQIADQLANDAFVPQEYFAYFTIESSLMNVVTLVVAGVFALRHSIDTALLTSVRMAIVTYAVVTGCGTTFCCGTSPTLAFRASGGRTTCST